MGGVRRLVACLADPARLRLCAGVVLARDEGMPIGDMDGPDVAKHVGALINAGLVEASDDRMRLNVTDGVFRELLGQLPEPEGGAPELRVPRAPEERLTFLAELAAQLFDPTRTYDERAVDDALRTVHTDPTTLRRYLIDYGVMARTPDGRFYWVIGESAGRIHV